MSRTSVFGVTVRAPFDIALSRIKVPACSESTTDTLGVNQPPTRISSLMKGTFSLTSAGVIMNDSMPHALADVIRRRNSSIRASVLATSIPPLVVLTPIFSYSLWLSSVR